MRLSNGRNINKRRVRQCFIKAAKLIHSAGAFWTCSAIYSCDEAGYELANFYSEMIYPYDDRKVTFSRAIYDAYPDDDEAQRNLRVLLLLLAAECWEDYVYLLDK